MCKTKTKIGHRLMVLLLSISMIFTMIPTSKLQVFSADENTAEISVVLEGDAVVELNGIIQDKVNAEIGSEVPVKITPSEGSYIKELKVGDESVEVNKGDAFSTTITVENDIVIEATVTKEYKVTAVPSEGGTITLNDKDKAELTVDENTTVKMGVNAKEGYQISSVAINGELQTIDNKKEFVKDIEVKENVEITAAFEKVYTVTITYNENGVVLSEPEITGGSVEVVEGKTLKITADPDENYRVSEVVINDEVDETITGNNFDSDDKYEKELKVNKDYTIKVTFALNRYTLTVSTSENGKVKLDTEELLAKTVDYNGSIKVSLCPEDGYVVETIKLNDVAVGSLTSDDNDIYFMVNDIKEDQKVDVTFKKSANADIRDVTFDKADALRYSENENLYVYSKDAIITFRTEKEGIKLYDADKNVLGGDEKTQSIEIQDTTSIGKIKLFYRDDNELMSAWHDVAQVTFVDSLNIEIDDKKAEVVVTPSSPNEYGYYNSDVEVNVKATDKGNYSGIDSVEYWVMNGDTETKRETLYTYTDGSTVENVFQELVTISALENNGDNITVYVKVIDRAGNVETVSTPLKISTDKPIVTVNIDGVLASEGLEGYYNSSRTATVTYTDKETTFDEKLAMEGIEITAVNAKGEDVAIVKEDMVTWSHNNDTHIATIIFDKDARYKWDVSYVNKADQSVENVVATGETPFEFSVDTVAPDVEIKLENNTWNDLLSSLTFGIYKNEALTVVAEGTDLTTDVKEILYYKSNTTEPLTEEQLNEKYANQEFATEQISVNTNERFNVYARVSDNAGNVKYVSTDGAIYDEDKPMIDIVAPEANENGYYNKDIDISISVNEEVNEGVIYSGIKSVEYIVQTDDEVTKREYLYQFDIEHPTYEQLEKDFNETIKIDSKENNADNVKVIVKAIDNAGNVSEKETVFSINTDKVHVKIEYGDKANKYVEDDRYEYDYGYFNEARTATITIIDRASAFDKESANNGIVIEKVEDINGNLVELQDGDIVISDWTSSGDQHKATVTFNRDGIYTWSFSYTNKADNKVSLIEYKTKESPFAFTIDKEDPTGSVKFKENIWSTLLETLTFGLYSNNTIEVEAIANDQYSPYTVEYCLVSDSTPKKQEELDQLKFKEYKQKIEMDEDNVYVVYLKITDYAGNYTYVSSNGFVLDKVASTIQLNATNDGVYNQNTNAIVEVTVKETENEKETYSGINTIEYWVENNKVKTQEGKLFTFDNTDPKYKDLEKEWNGTIKVDKTKNNSSNVVVYVKTVDNAGNESIEKVNLDIDIIAPEITIKFDRNKDYNNNSYFDNQRTASIFIKERMNHFDAKKLVEGIKITAVDAKGNPVEDAYRIGEPYVTEIHTDNADETIYKATIFFEKDANYEWSIEYTDEAGNKNADIKIASGTQQVFDFTIDTVAPTGTIKATSAEGREKVWDGLKKDLTFGFWSKEKIKITATYDDVTSAPIKSIEYFKVRTNSKIDTIEAFTKKELDGVHWLPFEGLEITYDELFTVYLKITDLAGNYTYLSTDGLIVDHTAPVAEMVAPEIKVEPEESNTDIYNGDVKVNIKVEDPKVGKAYSGLKKITYKVFNMGVETQKGTLYEFKIENPKQSDLLQSWEGEITVNSKTNNSNNVKIEVYAEDNSKNTSDEKEKIKIDITRPEINITYDNNNVDSGEYFKASRTAKIEVVERNFDAKDIKVKIENSDGKTPKLGKWIKTKASGNQDKTKWTNTLTYADEGDYTFSISYKDLASNPNKKVNYGNSVAPTKFTVDKTLPVVNVSYNNNAANNGKYFNAPRSATVVVNEHNFDVSRVVFSQTAGLDGTNIAVPSASWTNNGDVHTATIVFDQDGDYTFDVSVTDKAANVSGGANYGDSVAANDFVIDQNITKPTISGIDNGSAYESGILPSISFDDVNYDRYEVQLLRTRLGEIDADVTADFMKGINENTQGVSGTFDTFEEVVENDGIYTLILKVTDKAGNEESEQYTFSLNRFGSVYEYGDELVSLIKNGGQFVTSVDKNLVITEYNADQILENSLKILITRDGEPIDVKYTSNPRDINSQVGIGESGWYQYEYVIDASNFTQDGVYKISLTSEYAASDSAKNESTSVPENSVDKAGNSIVDAMNFTVDSVSPEIRNVVNLDQAIADVDKIENGKLNVKYTIVDVGGLKSVEVFVNGEVIQTLTEKDFAENLYNYTGNFDLEEQSGTKAHKVQIKVTDLAGNVMDTSSEEFLEAHAEDNEESTYVFHDEVTVSSNVLVRWYANTALFWISIIALILIAGFVFYLVVMKKQNQEETAEATQA